MSEVSVDELGRYQWPRPSKSVNGRTRVWTVREMMWLYRRGWTNGASGLTPHRDGGSGLPPYDAGFAAGKVARERALTDYAESIGFQSSVLRLVETGQVHPSTIQSEDLPAAFDDFLRSNADGPAGQEIARRFARSAHTIWFFRDQTETLLYQLGVFVERITPPCEEATTATIKLAEAGEVVRHAGAMLQDDEALTVLGFVLDSRNAAIVSVQRRATPASDETTQT